MRFNRWSWYWLYRTSFSIFIFFDIFSLKPILFMYIGMRSPVWFILCIYYWCSFYLLCPFGQIDVVSQISFFHFAAIWDITIFFLINYFLSQLPIKKFICFFPKNGDDNDLLLTHHLKYKQIPFRNMKSWLKRINWCIIFC